MNICDIQNEDSDPLDLLTALEGHAVLTFLDPGVGEVLATANSGVVV